MFRVEDVPIKVDDKGRIILPKFVRENMNIEPGDEFKLSANGDVIRLTQNKPVERAWAELIVRCKDCLHYRYFTTMDSYACMIHREVDGEPRTMPEDGFCSESESRSSLE